MYDALHSDEARLWLGLLHVNATPCSSVQCTVHQASRPDALSNRRRLSSRILHVPRDSIVLCMRTCGHYQPAHAPPHALAAFDALQAYHHSPCKLWPAGRRASVWRPSLSRMSLKRRTACWSSTSSTTAAGSAPRRGLRQCRCHVASSFAPCCSLSAAGHGPMSCKDLATVDDTTHSS